jgi:hypothetical protein
VVFARAGSCEKIGIYFQSAAFAKQSNHEKIEQLAGLLDARNALNNHCQDIEQDGEKEQFSLEKKFTNSRKFNPF